jgi:hypothetical protein
MRFARAAGVLVVVLALVRCGAPVRETPTAPTARAEPRAAEVAIAPAPRAVAEKNVRAVAPAPVAVVDIPHLDEVRSAVHSLGRPGCGSMEVLDNDGKPFPWNVRPEIKRLRAIGVCRSSGVRGHHC